MYYQFLQVKQFNIMSVMKNLNISVAIIASLFMFTCCKEDSIKTYNGENYVHFTYMKDRSEQKIEFNFAYDAPLKTECEVYSKISLWGYLLKEDTTIEVLTDPAKTTAIPGKDYIISNDNIFHKGVPEDKFKIIVRRNEKLLNTDYTIRIRLESIGDCIIEPEEYRYSTIHIIDKVSKPSWWKQSIASNLGKYSDIKYRVFIIYMKGKILKDLRKYSGIQFKKEIDSFKKWWKQEWEKGNYKYYTEDGNTPLYETIK